MFRMKLYRKWKSAASLLLVMTMLLQLAPVAYAEEMADSVLDGQVIITNSEPLARTSIEGDVVTITLAGDNNLWRKNTVTIQNNSGSAAELSFNYELSGHYDTDLPDNAGTITQMLENEESVTIYYDLDFDANITSKLVLSGFDLKEAVAEAGIIVDYDSELGSVTMNEGEAVIEPGTSIGDTEDSNLTVTAVPGEDTIFLGWVDTATHKRLSTEETYTHTPTGDTTIMPAFARADKPAWFSACGQFYVNDLNEANALAKESPNRDYKIILLSDGILEGDAEDTIEYIIDSGVQLLIPYDEAHTATFGAEPGTSTAEPGSSQHAFRTLTVEEGATLVCEGEICVNGQIEGTAGDYTGVPTGPYGHIELSEGAELIVDSGTLYCYGYITGDGEVIANGGTLYEVFQLLGWRGGSVTAAWAKNAGVIETWGSTDNIKSFAFNDYAVQNIEADLTVNKGATARGVAAVSVSFSDSIITKMVDMDYIGTGTGFVQFQSEDASVTRSLDAATGQMTYTLHGTILVDGISITLKFTGLEAWGAIVAFGTDTIEMKSADHILAIPSYMNFVAAGDGDVTLKNNYKLLPGATLTVEEGGTATVKNNLYIYDTQDYAGQGYVSGNSIPVAYIATTGDVAGDLPKMTKATSSGQVIVNGTLQIDGALYTTENSGTSVDKVLKGSGVVINNSSANAAVADKLDEFTYKNDTIVDNNIRAIPVVGQIAGVSVGDEYHSFANNGATYYGVGDGYWYQHAVSADKFENIKNFKNLSEEVTAGVNRNRTVTQDGKKISNIIGFISDYLNIEETTEIVTTPFTFTVPARTEVEVDNGTLVGKGTVAEPFALTVESGNTVLTAETAVAGENELLMQYDDHLDISEYGENVAIIDEGSPTSYQVGYGIEKNSKLDDAVVTIEGNYLVATGIGTAVVELGGVRKTVEVTAAPISMLFLGGQSNMQGSRGDGKQSIVCPEGMVYGTYGDRYGMSNSNATQYAPSALTGLNSLINKTGGTAKLSDYPVMMHNAGVKTTSSNNAGVGKNGPDSGFAYQWVESTGEKVWVINAAHGGSAIDTWQKSATIKNDKNDNYHEAVKLFKACQETMQQEIAAGHYTLSHMGFYWCQGESDSNKSAEYYVPKFLQMYEDLKADLSADMDSDPSTPDQTLEFCNIILTFAGSLDNHIGYRYDAEEDLYVAGDNAGWRTHEELEMRGQRVAQLWMAANPAYPDINVVCNIADGWYNMPDNADIPNGTLSVADYFQKHYPNGEINYPTQESQSDAWKKPDGPEDVRYTGTDGSGRLHYNQRGFNEIGREAVRNTMILLGYAQDPEDVETEVTFYDWTGYREVESIKAATEGQSSTLVVPVVSPIYRSKDVTYTTSTGVNYEYYDLITDTKSINGTLTAVGASNAENVRVVGRDLTEFRWELDGDTFKSVGVTENVPTKAEKAGSISNGMFKNMVFELEDPIVLNSDESWLVEWKMTIPEGKTSAWRKILTNNADWSVGDRSIMVRDTGAIAISQTPSGTHMNYQQSIKDGLVGTHVVRLVNVVNKNGTNMVDIYLDGTLIGPANLHTENDVTSENNWVSGQDFIFSHISQYGYPLNDISLEYLYVKESGATAGMHVHNWSDWKVTIEPNYSTDGEKTRTCSCGETETIVIPKAPKYIRYRWELNGDKLESVPTDKGYTENPLTLQKLTDGTNKGKYGSINAETGIFTNVIYGMEIPIQLKQDQDWSVEIEMRNTWTKSVTKLLTNYTGMSLIKGDLAFAAGKSSFGVSYLSPDTGKHVNYLRGSLNAEGDSEYHTYRIYNAVDPETQDYQVYVSYENDEGQKLDAVVNDWDYTFSYIGNENYHLSEGSIRYIEVQESGATAVHTYDEGVVTTEPTCTEDGVKTYTCTECGHTYTEPVSATGHTYVVGAWTWTEQDNGGYTASLSFDCACGDSKSEAAVVTDKVTLEPTEETEGTRIYTATVTVDEETYTDQKSVTIPVIGGDEPADPASHIKYRWELQGDKLVSTGRVDNPLLNPYGSIDEYGIFNDVCYTLTTPIQLDKNKDWSIEFEMINTWSGDKVIKFLNNNRGGPANGDVSIGLAKESITVCLYSNGHKNPGAVSGITRRADSDPHKILIYNEWDAATETNKIYVSVDDGKPVEMTPDGNFAASGRNFTLSHIGNSGYPLTGGSIRYIEVQESNEHIWGDWEVVTPPTHETVGEEQRTCTLCGETETQEIPKLTHTKYRWELNAERNKLESVKTDGFTENVLIHTNGSINGGVTTDQLQYRFTTPVVLEASKDWSVKWEMSGSTTKWQKILAQAVSGPGDYDDFCLMVKGKTTLALGMYKKNDTHYNYSADEMATAGIDMTGQHTYRLVNEVGEDNSNRIMLYVDDNPIGYMDDTDKTNYWLPGADITFNYIGQTGSYPLNGAAINYIEIQLEGASEDKFNETYRWDFQNNELVSKDNKNDLTKTTGTINSDGLHDKVQYALARPIILNHDKDWIVEFRMSNSGVFETFQKLFAETKVRTNGDKSIMSSFDKIVLGHFNDSTTLNYGASELPEAGIDLKQMHTYRLENRVENGSNMVYLSVDGEPIGAMDNQSSDINKPNDWANEKDFVFRYLGQHMSGTDARYSLQGITWEYIRIQESSQGHVHKHAETKVTAPTCTADGYTTYTCIACDDSYVDDYVEALGHLYGKDGKCIRCDAVHSGSSSGGGGSVGAEVAQIMDDRAYATLEDAIKAYKGKGHIQMLTASTAATTINRPVLIDLNGLAVSNVTVTAENVCFMDSTANGYDAPGGTLTVVSGADKINLVSSYDNGTTIKHYVKIADGNTYSFYRVAVSVTGMQFAFDSTNEKGYLTFQGTFRGNKSVVDALTDLGFSINGENVTWYKKATGKDANEFVMEDGVINFFYTEALETVKDVESIAAAMEFGANNTAGSMTRDVLAVLKLLKDEIAGDKGLTDEQKEVLKDFFTELQNDKEA